jgi:hypothetical protein
VGDDAPGRLDAVEHRHRKVHENDVRMRGGSLLDGLLTVGTAADDFETVSIHKRGNYPITYQVVIIHDKNSYHL